ncbi:MAG: (2Fe-2S) ferredoxin domain-containing protein [Firmicutes bacterium]|nr:(2Fe-2S) ferredoxin domain-containing protein [Bacillota bacterium]
MDLTLCVGSSCHLKGSPAIIERITALIVEHHLEDKINLSGSFCMEQCTKGSSGVCVQVNGVHHSVTAATIDDFFRQEVLNAL